MDNRADIYSIGKILELVFLKPNRRIKRVISRCTEENRDNRPANIEMLRRMWQKRDFSSVNVAVVMAFCFVGLLAYNVISSKTNSEAEVRHVEAKDSIAESVNKETAKTESAEPVEEVDRRGNAENEINAFANSVERENAKTNSEAGVRHVEAKGGSANPVRKETAKEKSAELVGQEGEKGKTENEINAFVNNVEKENKMLHDEIVAGKYKYYEEAQLAIVKNSVNNSMLCVIYDDYFGNKEEGFLGKQKIESIIAKYSTQNLFVQQKLPKLQDEISNIRTKINALDHSKESASKRKELQIQEQELVSKQSEIMNDIVKIMKQ